MACWLLLPVKPATNGKSRLSAVLSDAEREALNRRMFAHIFAVATSVVPAERCIVISNAPEYRDIARAAGAFGEEDAGTDLNAALTQGAMKAQSLGAAAVLSLSGDLPFLGPDDIVAMIEAAETADVVIATDHQHSGTNALLVRPPLAIAYLYGEDSLRAHHAATLRALLTAKIVDRPGLARDIDTPEDLGQLGQS